MPDDARERLRRAQHPGHRRQAHPADPQRDEHRRRRARSAIAPPTSSTCCSTRRPAAPTSPTRRASTSRRLDALEHFGFSSHRATCSPRSRPRSCSASAPTTRSSRSPPTARRCTRASGPRRSPPASAASSTTSTPARSSASISPTSRPTRTIECTERDRLADLQPRLLHLGRAAGHAVRAVRSSAAPRSFWRGLRRYLAVWDEMIRDFNAASPRLTALTIGPRRRLPLRGVRRHRRRRRAFPWRCPSATDGIGTTCSHIVRRSRRCARPTTRTRSSPSAPTSRGHAFADAHGMSDRRRATRWSRELDAADRRGRRHRLRVTEFAPLRRAVRRARLLRRRRRVGEGRDRQRRRAATRPVT